MDPLLRLKKLEVWIQFKNKIMFRDLIIQIFNFELTFGYKSRERIFFPESFDFHFRVKGFNLNPFKK